MLKNNIKEIRKGFFKKEKEYLENPIKGLKAQRSEDVSNLIVTTDSGKVFDADEISQNRISRTIQALEGANLDSADWKLANNSIDNITVTEFKEVLYKSFVAQSSLWFN